MASDDLRQDIAPVEGGENNSLGGGRGEGYSNRLGVRGIGGVGVRGVGVRGIGVRGMG